MQKVKPTKSQIQRLIQSYTDIESLLENCRQLLQQSAPALQALSNGSQTPAKTPTEPMPIGTIDLAIITALNDCAAIGIHVIPRPWLAVLARVSPKSGMYRESLARVIRAGWVQKAGTGAVSLGDGSTRPQNLSATGISWAEIGIRISDVLKPKEADILLALLKKRDEWVPRSEIFENPNSSHNREKLSQLKKQGFIEFGQNQTVRITLQWFLHPEANA